MDLKKRECPIKMKLVPYGAGWTDVYADFGEGELYFIISHVLGHSFETLMHILYYFYPDNFYLEGVDESVIDCKYGICDYIDGEYVITRIVDDIRGFKPPFVVRDIPWKASFEWNEEGSCSDWTLERVFEQDNTFYLKISIDVCRAEIKHYEYEVKYEDMCYAVADACTRALKKHGFWGYHRACYTPDMNVRYLLFLKSVALGNMEARELTYYEEQGKGETSDFNKEIELLLFDM